jgi:hypothetical protein
MVLFFNKAFFMVVWLGYVVRKIKDTPMPETLNIHFIGYIVIALIYLIFAIKS